MSETAPIASPETTAAAVPAKKITLDQMAEFMAELVYRLTPIDGNGEFEWLGALSSRQRDVAQATLDYLIFSQNHEQTIRAAVLKARKARA